jgi:hypothetical protein
MSMLVFALAMLVATGAHARGGDDDPDRQARRQELRQQLEAERERWRAEGGRRGQGGQPGYRYPDGRGPGRDGTMAPGYAPGPGAWGGERPGWSGAPRLSPEERRELRRELREQRP